MGPTSNSQVLIIIAVPTSFWALCFNGELKVCYTLCIK